MAGLKFPNQSPKKFTTSDEQPPHGVSPSKGSVGPRVSLGQFASQIKQQGGFKGLRRESLDREAAAVAAMLPSHALIPASARPGHANHTAETRGKKEEGPAASATTDRKVPDVPGASNTAGKGAPEAPNATDPSSWRARVAALKSALTGKPMPVPAAPPTVTPWTPGKMNAVFLAAMALAAAMAVGDKVGEAAQNVRTAYIPGTPFHEMYNKGVLALDDTMHEAHKQASVLRHTSMAENLKNNQFEAAEGEARHILEDSPKDNAGWIDLGLALEGQNRTGDAIKHWTEMQHTKGIQASKPGHHVPSHAQLNERIQMLRDQQSNMEIR